MTAETKVRPLVTFALFAYNQERYIREAVEGAFAQTYEPLEIILSDDCSTDRTFEVIKRLADRYSGPHKVNIRRNAENVGVATHFDRIMQQAEGQLVVVAAGDDISARDRTMFCANAFKETPQAGVIEAGCENFMGSFQGFDSAVQKSSLSVFTQTKFTLADVLKGKESGLIGAGRAYSRKAYNRFPALMRDCPEEDTPALFRSLYASFGLRMNVDLVARRIHSANLSHIESMSRMDFGSLTRQYQEDFLHAVGRGLIEEAQVPILSSLFDRYSFRKRCAIQVFSGFQDEVSAFDVAKSEHFSVREKIYLLRKAFGHRIRAR